MLSNRLCRCWVLFSALRSHSAAPHYWQVTFFKELSIATPHHTAYYYLNHRTRHRPGLLHKNPARVQSFELHFGKVHVFYPETTPERCTAALLLDIESVHLVHDQRAPLEHYVND